MMSIEEAIKMQGTEFVYEFATGRTITGYIKKFDPKVGLSCWSFGLETDDGYKFEPLNKEEDAEQACCLIGYDLKKEPEYISTVMEIIDEIYQTGRRVSEPDFGGYFSGCPL